MGDARLRPAVLVISDTASKDPSTDKAGNILADTFSADGGDQWRPPIVKIVPDSIIEIQQIVRQWSDNEDYFNLIITTGGTGFAVKDVTPEVGFSVVPPPLPPPPPPQSLLALPSD
jgi:gephyrin